METSGTLGETDVPPAPQPRPIVIGWKERLNLPEWGLRRVRVKVDTGARTSALGVLSYELHQDPDHGLVARVRVALSRKRPERVVEIDMPVLRFVNVRNSCGLTERRPVVETLADFGVLRKRIRLTLTNRAAMRFPMILGRTALEGDFLVDVSRKRLLRPTPPRG